MSFFDYPNEQPAASDQVEQLLADASEAEWATLLRHTRHRRFGPGETVVTAGERERSLYLVLDGRLEVLAEHGRRRLRRVATIEVGSVLGELSFFDGAPRSALVRTMTPAFWPSCRRPSSTPSRPRTRCWPGGCCSTWAGSWRSGCGPPSAARR